jgi:hypothetical protein
VETGTRRSTKAVAPSPDTLYAEARARCQLLSRQAHSPVGRAHALHHVRHVKDASMPPDLVMFCHCSWHCGRTSYISASRGIHLRDTEPDPHCPPHAYVNGISYPAKGTIFAPCSMWRL